MVTLQRRFDAGEHRRGRGVGTAGIGHQRDDEGLEHRASRTLQHVRGEQRIATADEDGRARHALRAAREDGVLSQRSHRVDADIGVRRDDLVARVGRHVDVERTDLMAWVSR
jgi:hypothetical protein